MVDYDRFGYGGAQYPLTASTTNSLLRDVDPALYYTLDYFTSVLNTHLNARVAATAAVAPAVTEISSVVAHAVPLDPVPYLLEQQFEFPLLAVYRVKSTFEERSVTWPSRISEWNIDYLLPPLTGGQAERFLPILKGVSDVLHNRIENMFDPAYQSGLKVWQAANIDTIRLVSEEFGRWDAADGLSSFHHWGARLQVRERVTPATVPFGPLTGIDVIEDLVSTGEPTVSDFVDWKVDLP